METVRKFEVLCNSSNHATSTSCANKDVPLGGSATGSGSRWLSLDSPGQTSSRQRRVEIHEVCHYALLGVWSDKFSCAVTCYEEDSGSVNTFLSADYGMQYCTQTRRRSLPGMR
jgi:hypothetical protein